MHLTERDPLPHAEVSGLVAHPHAFATYAPAQAGAAAGTRCPARTVSGVDDPDASPHAFRRFRESTPRIRVLGWGVCIHVGPPGGAALHSRLGPKSGQCARQAVEAVTEDLRLSPSDAGACVYGGGGLRGAHA